VRGWDLSYVVWTSWLSLFLVFELIPVFWKGCPWKTLSGTSWHAESSYPIVQALLLGFILGVGIHIVYRVPMLQAQLFGLGFSLLTHLVHFRKQA
jgi:hypothetical protein